jgi:hypothetical protein
MLEVPEEVYESLVRSSEQTGQPLEKLAAQWLASAAQYLANDTLEEFIGAFNSNGSDWADEHDKYLGEA